MKEEVVPPVVPSTIRRLAQIGQNHMVGEEGYEGGGGCEGREAGDLPRALSGLFLLEKLMG